MLIQTENAAAPADAVEAAPPVGTPSEVAAETWMWLGGMALIAIIAGILAHTILFAVMARLATNEDRKLIRSIVERMAAPSRIMFPLLALQFVLGSSVAGVTVVSSVVRVATVALIMSLTWAAIRGVSVLEDFITARHRLDVPDNYQARRVTTQVTVLGRMLIVVMLIVGIAASLMTFPQVRQVGASLLASAGIIGLVTGMAARPIVENLLAGIQIAFTEPIQLDDVVVIQKEWGRIEEVTPTYIVVRIWDDRRLVVPLSYFITNPIENWTRRTANVLGTVTVHADYTAPVPVIRAELERILNESPLWDRRAWALQVTGNTANTVELRALMSARDGSQLFDLRCQVREKLIDFIQREFRTSLPRTRTEFRVSEPGLIAGDPNATAGHPGDGHAAAP